MYESQARAKIYQLWQDNAQTTLTLYLWSRIISHFWYIQKEAHFHHSTWMLGIEISPELHREIPLIHYLPPNHHHSKTVLWCPSNEKEAYNLYWSLLPHGTKRMTGWEIDPHKEWEKAPWDRIIESLIPLFLPPHPLGALSLLLNLAITMAYLSFGRMEKNNRKFWPS